MPAFEATVHKVSNGEYLEFVKDAGYARRELWTESGWGWKMFRNSKHPQFWISQVTYSRVGFLEALDEFGVWGRNSDVLVAAVRCRSSLT